MKYLQFLLLALLPITAYTASWMVFPEEAEIEQIESQKEIYIKDKISQSHICRAAVIAMMDYEISNDTKSKQINPISSVVSRHRKEDNTTWKYLCKLDGNNIVWAAMNISGPQKIDIGRWRIHTDDIRYIYVIRNDGLIFDYIDGNFKTPIRAFSLKEIKKW